MESINRANLPAYNSSLSDNSPQMGVLSQAKKTEDASSTFFNKAKDHASSLQAQISVLSFTKASPKAKSVFTKLARNAVRSLTKSHDEQKIILKNIKDRLIHINAKLSQGNLEKEDIQELRHLYWSEAQKIKEPKLRSEIRDIVNRLSEKRLSDNSPLENHLKNLKQEVEKKKEMAKQTLDELLDSIKQLSKEKRLVSKEDLTKDDGLSLSELIDHLMDDLK